MMIRDEVFMRLAEVAHANDITLESLLTEIEEKYKVDTSILPKNEKGEIVYPDGRVNLDFDLPDDLLLSLHTSAAERDMKTNDLLMDALMAKVEEVRKMYPEKFSDLKA